MSDYLIKLVVDDQDISFERAKVIVEGEIRKAGVVAWRDQLASDIWVAMIVAGRVCNETTLVDAISKAELFIRKIKGQTSDDH